MSSELRVNNFKARSGLGTVAVNESGLDVIGIVTATSFSGAVTGDVTGNATGLSGTPNITVNNVVAGIITATTFSGSGANLTNLNIPAAFNELDSALFN